MMKQIFILAMMLFATSGTAIAQDVALKTNLLGWATTSLNAGVEVGIAEKQTAQLFATINPWKFSRDRNLLITLPEKFVRTLLMPILRILTLP